MFLGMIKNRLVGELKKVGNSARYVHDATNYLNYMTRKHDDDLMREDNATKLSLFVDLFHYR